MGWNGFERKSTIKRLLVGHRAGVPDYWIEALRVESVA